MKNNELTIFKKFSFKKILLKITGWFNKRKIHSYDTSEITNESTLDKKDVFLQSISFKQNQEEKALIDKVKNNPNIFKSMTLEELKELNKAISNWKIYLSKRIEVAKEKIGIY